MVAISKLVQYLILIAIFVIIVGVFYAKTGIFTKTTTGAEEGLGRYIPNITLGADKLKGEKAAIPQEHQKEIAELKNTLQKMLDSEQGNCFIKFGGFSELGEEGTSIEMNYNSLEDTTNIIVLFGKEGKEAVVRENGFSLKGMRPCVIAGSGIAGNFDRTFLNQEEGAPSSYFKSVDRIRLDFRTEGVNANRISFGEHAQELNNFHDFEGHQWLFTPHSAKGRKEICFFPTTDGLLNCAARGDLLDDDCFEDSDEEGIPYQLRGKNTDSCATIDTPTLVREGEEGVIPPSLIESGRPWPGGVPEITEEGGVPEE